MKLLRQDNKVHQQSAYYAGKQKENNKNLTLPAPLNISDETTTYFHIVYIYVVRDFKLAVPISIRLQARHMARSKLTFACLCVSC